jgi:predicted RNA binding protein YcfA (HicA-like mRNA interferase family)
MADKYPVLKPDEIVSALSKRGFAYKSQKGSHAKYTNKHHTVIIPVHDTVARGTLKKYIDSSRNGPVNVFETIIK